MKNQEIQVWKSALNQRVGIYEGGGVFKTNSTVTKMLDFLVPGRNHRELIVKEIGAWG